MLYGIVLEYENDGEENDICDDNENDVNFLLLEGDYMVDMMVCLVRCICVDVVLICGKIRIFGWGVVIIKICKVNFDIVVECGEGNDDG